MIQSWIELRSRARLCAFWTGLALTINPALAAAPKDAGLQDIQDESAFELFKYPPDFGFQGDALCFGIFDNVGDHEKALLWYVFPSTAAALDGGTARPKLLPLEAHYDASVAREVSDHCGPRARIYLDLARASCGTSGEPVAALWDPGSLNVSFNDLPPQLPQPGLEEYAEAATRSKGGYYSSGTDVLCARWVSSADGRVRVWSIRLEHFIDEFERASDRAEQDDPDEPPSKEETYIRRGLAYVQRVNSDGGIELWRDGTSADLHLDTVVDSIVKTPGPPDEYLITGVRTYMTMFPGPLPRRYAQVIRLGNGALKPQPVKDAFLVQGKPRAALLLDGKAAFTGKFRHHALAGHWLRFEPNSGALRLEPIDPKSEYHQFQPIIKAEVARYLKGHFVVAKRRWGAISLVDNW